MLTCRLTRRDATFPPFISALHSPPSVTQDSFLLGDTYAAELPPLEDLDAEHLLPVLTPPQPMDFFDSEYRPKAPQPRNSRPRRQQQLQKTCAPIASSSSSSFKHPHPPVVTISSLEKPTAAASAFNHGGDDDNGAVGVSVVKKIETLQDEYSRVKHALLMDDGVGVGVGGPLLEVGVVGPDVTPFHSRLPSPCGPDIPRTPGGHVGMGQRGHDSTTSARPPRRELRSRDKLDSIFGSACEAPALSYADETAMADGKTRCDASLTTETTKIPQNDDQGN